MPGGRGDRGQRAQHPKGSLPPPFTPQRAAACGFPILSDKSLVMAKAFGVKRRSGMMARGSFLLDKERRVLHCSVYPRHLTTPLHPGHLRCVARSAEEVVRQVVSAARQVDSSQVLPPSPRQAGEEPLPDPVEARVTILDMEEPTNEKVNDSKENGENKSDKKPDVEEESKKSCEAAENGDTEENGQNRVEEVEARK